LATVVLLTVAYPFAMGPLGYASGRGWVSDAVFDALSFHARFSPRQGTRWSLYKRYVVWFWHYGARERTLRDLSAWLERERDPLWRERIRRSIDQWRSRCPEFLTLPDYCTAPEVPD
jgi:hypothetical protein